jgi:hypothetical protein
VGFAPRLSATVRPFTHFTIGERRGAGAHPSAFQGDSRGIFPGFPDCSLWSSDGHFVHVL